MKQALKNEVEVLGLINRIQEQLIALDKKVDTLISRSLPQTTRQAAPASPVNSAPVPAKPHDRDKARQMYDAVCADCQKECKIPFKPSPDRPVYCKDCYSRRRVISLSGIKVDDKPKETTPVLSPTKKETTSPILKVKLKKKAVTVKKTIAKKKLAPKKK